MSEQHFRCNACNHDDIVAIDEYLRDGMTYERVAEKFGLTKSSVARHANNHLVRVVVPDGPPPAPVSPDEEWREQLRQLYGAACSVLKKANDAGNSTVTLQAMKQAQSTIREISRMQERAGSGNKGTVAAQIQAGAVEGNALRQALFRALNPYPEAKAAVVRELLAIGAGGDPKDD